jgi:hypothetical protein
MKKKSRHERPLVAKNIAGKNISNPNEITVNQHVIPEKHLLRWSKDKKAVKFIELPNLIEKILPAGNPYFCVMRLWDQATEAGMLKVNEANFWQQIDMLEAGQNFSKPGYITEYYAMLCARIWVSNRERPHSASIFSEISHDSTKSELEQNELSMLDSSSVHYVLSTIQNDSQHIARQVVKLAMSRQFSHWREVLKSEKWLCISKKQDNYVLSDAFLNNLQDGIHILPISPNRVLVTEGTLNSLGINGDVDDETINSYMKKNAVNYYFNY